MAADCGATISKHFLCICNFIFLILGAILLGIGIWLAVDKSSLLSLLRIVESQHREHFIQPILIEFLAYIIIAFGAIIFVISFLGYSGALQENKCLLVTYVIVMILLIVGGIILGSLAVFFKTEVEEKTKSLLQSTITNYYSGVENPDAVSFTWNHVMSQLDCCGAVDYKDFNNSEIWNQERGNRTVPEVCCKLSDKHMFIPEDPKCTISPSEDNSYYKQGCYKAFLSWISNNRNILIGSCVSIAVFYMLSIFLALCLCKSIDKYHGLRL